MRTDDFKSLFKRGLFKTNRYLITIDGLRIKQPEMLRSAVYNVTAENVETVTSMSTSYGEPSIGVNFVRTHGQLQVSFINDAEGKVKEFLDEWTNAQRNKTTNEINYAEKYMASVMKIISLSQSNESIVYTNEYINVFPIKISGVIYSYDAGSVLPLINVTFQYSNTDSYKGNKKSDFNNISNFSMGMGNNESFINQNTFLLNNNGIGNTLADDLMMSSRWGVNDNVVDRINIDNDILSGKKDIV